MQDLVLVPGLTCTRALWAAQIAGLSDRARITIGDHTKDDSTVAIARRILAAAPTRFALAGLSLGGYIAFEIMRQAPERVTKLALLDTSAKPFDPAQAPQRHGMIELMRREGFLPVMEKLLPVFIHPDRLDDKPLVDAVVGMGRDTGVEVFAQQQAAIMSRADNRPLLTSIKVPTLVLTGRHDQLTPVAEHELIAAGIASSQLKIIENCGHLSTMERPDEVTAAMRMWLG